MSVYCASRVSNQVGPYQRAPDSAAHFVTNDWMTQQLKSKMSKGLASTHGAMRTSPATTNLYTPALSYPAISY
jgi:hypothetical protein